MLLFKHSDGLGFYYFFGATHLAVTETWKKLGRQHGSGPKHGRKSRTKWLQMAKV